MPKLRPGVVSVILVNFKGVDDTIEAINHLNGVDWPDSQLEIIVVENASGDNSESLLRAAHPMVRIVVSPTNVGFAGGCNLGVARSTGEFLAFLNNDAKPDRAWIRAAMTQFAQSPAIGAVASKVVDWDGNNVDFVGAALTWFGMGYKPLTAEPLPAREVPAHDVLFGTGSAMFVRRSVFEELEGFDERFFMFFEDVDLGWRLNLRGWRYVYEPKSIAFHKHHASMSSFGSFKETYLLERNALFALYKNLGAESLAEALPAAMALSVRRGVAKGHLDSTALDIRKKSQDGASEMSVSKESAASLFAIDQFVEALPGLKKSRDLVQNSRLVSDSRLWRLFGLTDAPSFQNDYYLAGYESIVTAFDVTEAPSSTRVLLITGDPIGAKMAGPAIRAWNIALALSKTSTVTLVTLSGAELLSAPFDIVHVAAGDNRTFAKLENWADVIIFQGHAMAVFDALRRTKKIVIADIYDPMHLEQLEQGRGLAQPLWDKQVADATDVLNEQLLRGDFFLCASERQRHFYLGQLAALGRVNPANYASDPDLNGLISVVPFGLDETPPKHVRQVLKSVVAGIEAEDKVLLWSGGLYNWFDPKTLIRAVTRLAVKRPNVRLFFQGTKHPHPGVPEMAIVAESRQLSSELGVLDKNVFFNASWVDYADRQNFLTESDAGVSTHFSHVETTFSFRTRVLDYLWAELPMVLTKGDYFAELVETEKLGIVVDAGDEAQLADALERVLFDEVFIAEVKANIHRVREDFFWRNTLEPLVSFVENAHHAPDRLAGGQAGTTGESLISRPRRRVKKHGFRHDLGLVVFYLRNGGLPVAMRKVRNRLGRKR
ncbi:glycosyltransferase [Cryobacterium sp. Hh11]|uniref:glycosyltransferase n=1 Tax=Cryobacterium sp. Hh11 TaxID=2555868 RepID=UPI001069B047|nr:glycosyltransferase [Cryobacterium sp. Hh11]TFD53383.1 glycosyltransferase [Cryobacterium sp. Hh11]